MMSSSWKYRVLFVFFLLAAAAAPPLTVGAQDDEEATEEPTEEATAESADDPVIRLVANNWLASELNVEVANILLEEEMGYDVEILDIGARDQWEALADGEGHAVLEVWPSGRQESIQEYIEEKEVVERGSPIGVVGKVGWHIPTYMLDDHPELATWEGFQDPDNAALFDTEETEGNAGAFYAGPESWIQYDAQIIDNLDMNLEVVRHEDEAALLDKLDAAYEDEEPILMYFWTPHWAYILYDLAQVTLPEHTEECYEQADTGGVDCDYPEDKLFKAYWPGLEDYAPEVYTFLENFNYTNRDQISMLAMVEVEELTADEAARRWVDNNEDTWQEWLP